MEFVIAFLSYTFQLFLLSVSRFYLSPYCILLVLDYYLNIVKLWTGRKHGFHCQTLGEMEDNG